MAILIFHDNISVPGGADSMEIMADIYTHSKQSRSSQYLKPSE
jgi:hypothetical protein